ncbi:MAG TPA: helix-turn-helix transcriptional regulator [Gaiellaceae bacterium]|jgi:transcriptional regulator with XRE-family HTH domain
MEITSLLSDHGVLEELGRRLARTRLEQNRTQADVALEAGVGIATVKRLERGHSVASTSLVRVLRALGLLEALDDAVREPEPSPLSLLKLEGRARQRARHAAAAAQTVEEPWRWGDERRRTDHEDTDHGDTDHGDTDHGQTGRSEPA